MPVLVSVNRMEMFLGGMGWGEVLCSKTYPIGLVCEPARLEILSRLSSLNRLRWEEEEKAGLHKKGKKK